MYYSHPACMRGGKEGIGLSDETRPTICFLAAPFKMFSNSWATLTCHRRSALCFERTSATVRLAFQTGGTLQGGECLAVPSLSLISNLARLPHVCSGTWTVGDQSTAFFFFSTESRAKNDIIVSLQYHLLFWISGRRWTQPNVSVEILFEATEFFQSLWIACFWRCDGRWKAASNG